MAPVYGHAMEVLACPDRCSGQGGHSLHDCLQSLCPMGRGWVTLAGVCGECAASCGGETPRPEHTPWRRDQHRGQKRGDGIGYSGHKHQKGEKIIAITDNNGDV